MESQEAVTYTYSLNAGNAPLQFFVLVESEPDRPNHYTFSLSMKVGHVERAVCKSVTMRLSIDPRQLDFALFAFPPRSSLPVGCLHHLRVWLRTAGIDHRIFGDNDLWVGKDPDFRSIGDASFAILRNATQDMLIYQAVVGRAHVSFIVRWRLVEVGVYALSLDYEAGGAGRTLFDDYHLRLDCEPQTVSFMIYSIPVTSTPAGASHRIRFWMRTPHVSLSPASSIASGPAESYVYQRLWKTDDFKLGANLNFEALGSKLITGVRDPNSPQSDRDLLSLYPSRRRRSRLTPNIDTNVSGERVNDR
ncbi:hypothetical protein HYDPIDRAFT_77734 [Hydnomerulius pinastri MD-312]|nr:hypothetical protein HYDPIDRAFT_77734 [Hydnomerulius pinastri MD-312]